MTHDPEKMRSYRAAARARGIEPGDPRHGTPSGYGYWGCRLECCRSVPRRQQAEWQAKKKRFAETGKWGTG